MVIKIVKLFLAATFAWLPFSALSQKNIVISDSLNANADKMNVKMGSQTVGKIWKFRFGDYAVVSSKMGWTKTSSKANLLNTRTESRTTQKFSFAMTGATTDTATVNAAVNIETKELKEFEVLPNFFVGNNELLKETNNFTALININGDTTDTWALLINLVAGTETEGKYRNESMLTNGTRKIFLVPVTSNKNGDDKRKIPAYGYELIENELALGAVQFYGGGIAGLNKNIIWIHRSLETKMKLMLAAAMTAVLQKMADNMSFELPSSEIGK